MLFSAFKHQTVVNTCPLLHIAELESDTMPVDP